MYVKDPTRYVFDADAVDREPYMAPGLVTAEKAARGKRPTDVWWHTIVPTNGRERTGYPPQKPEGILRRIVQASTRPGDAVLDLFAGSGTTGAVAAALGRDALLVDDNPEAIRVMRARLPAAVVVGGPVSADSPVVSPGGADSPVASPGGADSPVVSPGGADSPVVAPGGADSPVVAPGGADSPVVE